MEGDWRNRGKPGGKEEKEKGLQLPASSKTRVNSFDQLKYLDDNNDEGHDNYNGGDNCGDDCVKPKLSAFVSLCAGYLPMPGYS